MEKNTKQEAEAARFRQDIRSLLRTRVREAIEITLEEELAEATPTHWKRGLSTPAPICTSSSSTTCTQPFLRTSPSVTPSAAGTLTAGSSTSALS